MKRKLMYNDSQSVYSAPPLESTLLLEKGGLEDKQAIGALPSTNLSAALSSGTRTFQYNRFFWNKEWFTFNYNNNAIGIAIAYFRASTQSYSFAIYPIFLPRVAMTLLQSITSSPTDSFTDRTLLLKELIYYLNMGFTSLGRGNDRNPVNFGDAVVIAPWVAAIDAKGSPQSPSAPDIIPNNPDFPIFQDGATPPPLLWTYSGNNSQLCLRINPAFPNFADGDRIGFQIVTLEDYMAEAPWVSVSTALDPSGFKTAATFYTLLFNSYPGASYNDGKGWCSQGAFATGFAQAASYDFPDQSIEFMSTYGDIYSPTERRALWADTRFPMFTPNPTNLSQFMSLCTTHKLVSNCGNGTGILLSKFITSLIPYRYFTIESDALTRNQKRPVSSNNPQFTAPGTMAVQFITLDSLRTWNDNTVAGQTSSAGSILYGSRKSGVDDCSIVSMDPMQSLQTIDLTLRDEWGNILQNYTQLQTAQASTKELIMLNYDQFGILPEMFTIPAWVLPYNPIPSANNESLFINESWYASVYQFYGFNAAGGAAPNPTPNGFAPDAPRSTTLTHFGRVLGY